jgi:hypothetical protein
LIDVGAEEAPRKEETMEKKISKKAMKAAREQVSKAFYAGCCGMQIPMMELGKVMQAGLVVALAGGSEEEIQVVVVEMAKHVGGH